MNRCLISPGVLPLVGYVLAGDIKREADSPPSPTLMRESPNSTTTVAILFG